ATTSSWPAAAPRSPGSRPPWSALSPSTAAGPCASWRTPSSPARTGASPSPSTPPRATGSPSRADAVPVEPRPAASVLLIRPGRATAIEVFLIRRARDMRFLGGYYAFPGGKVDLADRGHDALARARGLSPDAAARAIGDPADEVPALAYWHAAVREVFEETGMLLARDAEGRPVAAGAPDIAPRLETHRRALVLGERSFTAMLTAEEWFADLAPLAYLSHFVPPPASPIRFSARFFLCPVPAGQDPRLIAEEASEGFWV